MQCRNPWLTLTIWIITIIKSIFNIKQNSYSKRLTTSFIFFKIKFIIKNLFQNNFRIFSLQQFKSIFNILPLLDLQSLSMPFLCNAILDNSQKLSKILKLQRGEISKKAIRCFLAYIWASFSLTFLLKAKCNLFPTKTFGTPGACFKKINKKIYPQTILERNVFVCCV